jgi:integrase
LTAAHAHVAVSGVPCLPHLAGLRIGEALSLRSRDVDLARGTITVPAAKTDAGIRTVNLLLS